MSTTPLSSADVRQAIELMGQQARQAAYALANLSAEKKNTILRAMAASLRSEASTIIAANALDLSAAAQKGLSNAMIDRLTLDETRIDAIASGIDQVATLHDPCGEILSEVTRPNGMHIKQVRVPIGVIGIIYESRPNVTSDAAVLCLKSGNATILRGGSEAIHSNRAIAAALQSGGESAGLPAHSIQLIPFTDRESVAVLAGMDRYLDLIIPRGGKGLIETVVSLARMPVIKHYDGICHTYIDVDADPAMAIKVSVNAKAQKPGVCNALETLLVHRDIAATMLPDIARAFREKNVELRGCAESCKIVTDLIPATEEDWSTEYLDYILSVKIVDSMQEAIAHINHYGSHHSDCIITANAATAETFLHSIDSACVFHNVSTRLADGEEFGFGAEIGISTDKLHARGPMALRELTSYQYRITGDGVVK
ncbi:MAG: glutamate-5-semialdehyde dehydrogenase [Verrucomicrobiia bacterium Tous-C3TDCM]|nr:MAG: glutamate-5-semialdehyde dehydrogenase [Verrucomicrobiae bacterium Tous-C3TDCM]PAZ06236.1 MAG: glutamate-5-semialdehyde dehydrogenase [Verrucomicrobiae bacterium AMD-G2]